MGNCVRRESSMVWAEDDWDSVAHGKKIVLYDAGNNNHCQEEHEVNMEERQRLLGEEGNSSGSKVKIKITKRELEELMARVDMQGLRMEEILERLLSCEDYCHDVSLMEDDHHQRTWKPALQSIPE